MAARAHWAATPFDERAAIFLRAADLLAGEKDATRVIVRALDQAGRPLPFLDDIATVDDRAGLDAAELRAGGPSEAQLDALHEQFTKDALAVGVFGAPSFVLPSGEIF
mgnify:CR=1 FL=1